MDHLDWSDAQKEAYLQMANLMREHFDCGVMYVCAETSDQETQSCGAYHGGFHAAIGLHQQALNKLMDNDRSDE